MSRDDDPERKRSSRRALRILERLSGSGRSAEESLDALENTRVADRLHQIEQLFLLHGGERESDGPDADSVLFEWGHLQALERIGEGSSGEVFRAYDRTLDREVALKLLKTDRDRPFQSQLFLHEARQLAMVRHRNVLAVHGATVHDGRPGLWTELIEGGTADDAMHRAAFDDPDAVLDLVESLALAVDAVHSVGLVHGDIKPSNIMRDAAGDWVLMDFGASQDQRGGPDGPSITSGTPLYMAPEVVLGNAPDVASDRYSLGATLYRVLTGRAPLEADTWSALVEKHRSGARPAPAADSGRIDRRVARLVDALMARAPEQRPTLPEVLDEIQAIREAPQRRFRRLALGGIAAALLIGLALTSIGFYRANEARLIAEQEQRNTFAVNEFLQHVLFTPASTGRGLDMTVEDMLREAATSLERTFVDQPAARIVVRRVLASSFKTVNLHDLATDQIERARQELADEGIRLPTVERKLSLVEMLVASGERRWEDVIEMSKRFLDQHADSLGEGHEDVRFARAYRLDAYNALGRLDEAEALLDEHFADVPAPETASNNIGANILRNRTNLYTAQGRFEEALTAAEAAVDWLERFPQSQMNDRVDALTNLAITLSQLNEMDRAIEVFAELVPIQERINGPGTDEHVAALSNLSYSFYQAGRPTDARATLETALEAVDEHPGRLSEQQRLIVMINLANALNATGEQQRGEAILRETLADSLDLLGPRSALTLALNYNLAELLSQQGRFEEARALAEPAVAVRRDAFGADHYLTQLARDNLAVALAGLGRADEAMALHNQALASLSEQFGNEHPYTLVVQRNRLKTLADVAPGRIAPGAVDELIERHVQALGADHPDTDKARALRSL